ncbi:hypothetical protein [Allorhizobium borbori]|uniref:Uncharacterized protein n=1 Tax=Allorhizobium borbori TaxID=485907 RepID=A0A7W6K1C7_9HYPH|nr:hypothetical protein [Allorhizobium borbori]MBB4102406.1 hypothetical protein [Allorhizobium borbori]
MLTRRVLARIRKKYETSVSLSQWYAKVKGIGLRVVPDAEGYLTFPNDYSVTESNGGYLGFVGDGIVAGSRGGFSSFAQKWFTPPYDPLAPDVSAQNRASGSNPVQMLRDVLLSFGGRIGDQGAVRVTLYDSAFGTNIFVRPEYSHAVGGVEPQSPDGTFCAMFREDWASGVVLDRSGVDAFPDADYGNKVVSGSFVVPYYDTQVAEASDCYMTIASSDRAIGYHTLPDDPRLRPFIPAGAESLPVLFSRRQVIGSTFARAKNATYFIATIRYDEARKAPDNAAVNGFRNAQASYSWGSVSALCKLSPGNVVTVENILYRHAFYHAPGRYAFTTSDGMERMHVNSRPDGATEADFPPRPRMPHPQNIHSSENVWDTSLEPSNGARLLKMADYMFVHSSGRPINQVLRVRLGLDNQTALTFVTLPENWETWTAFENHGVLLLVEGDNATIHQSIDAAETFRTWVAPSASLYHERAAWSPRAPEVIPV